jgi:hypothetical protein
MKNKLTFNIREVGETLVPDRTERSSYLLALLIACVMFLLITLLWGKLPPLVPIYLSLPWGEGRLASRVMFYLLPIITLAVMVVNVGLGRLLGKLSMLLPRVLSAGAVMIAVMMMIALLGIIQSLLL